MFYNSKNEKIHKLYTYNFLTNKPLKLLNLFTATITK